MENPRSDKNQDSCEPAESPPPPGDAATRNSKGEWRPDYPCRYSPLFSWPPRPRAIIEWIIGSPGFVWPVNLALLAISAFSWFFLLPELETCRQLQWQWILQIYLVTIGLISGVYGGFYLLMYILKVDGTKRKYTRQWPNRNGARFLFRNQVYDNVFWTLGVGGLVTSLYLVVSLWMYANNKLPFLSWEDHPVIFVLWIAAIPFWREFHFYWIHRLIHWKPLYKHVHYLHHKNVDVNPWSGMAMHPVETVLYLSVCLIHWVIPSHPFHLLFNLQHAALAPVSGHLGFEGPVMDGKVPVGSYFHYLHHRYFECNYGESTLPLDRWFGTFRDGLPSGEGSKLSQEHTIEPTPARHTSSGPA